MWRKSVHVKVCLLFAIVTVSVISTTFLIATLESRRFLRTATMEQRNRFFGVGRSSREYDEGYLDLSKSSVDEKSRETKRTEIKSEGTGLLSVQDESVAARTENAISKSNIEPLDTGNSKQVDIKNYKQDETKNSKQVGTADEKSVETVKEKLVQPSNEKLVAAVQEKTVDNTNVKQVASVKEKTDDKGNEKPVAAENAKSSLSSETQPVKTGQNKVVLTKNKESNAMENNKQSAAGNNKPVPVLDNKIFASVNNKPVETLNGKVSATGNSKPVATAKDKQIASKKCKPDSKPVTPKPLPKVCDDWRLPNTNWSEVIQPQFTLDPTKFLYPGLIWGPNNQLVGFYQSIFMAIRLNRTLVVPQFHPHDFTGVIPAQERIDVTRLRSFVSTITLERFRDVCKGSFDVAFQTQLVSTQTIAAVEEDTKMTLFQIPEDRARRWGQGSTEARFSDRVLKKKPNIPAFPSLEYELRRGPWLNGSAAYLNKLYNTKAPCAIFSAPFNPIKVYKTNLVALPINGSGLNEAEVDDRSLYAAVVDAVRRPRCVVEAAELYRREIFGDEDYVGVHWRFDTNDWIKVHCLGPESYRFTEMCETIPKIIPLDVATAISTSLKRTWTRIYIATPPKLDLFGFEVIEELRKLNKNLKPAKIGFFHFTLRRFEPCWLAANWSSPGEINALFDMEMMKNSSWLYYSDISTFSNNVRYLRSERAKDGLTKRIFEKSAFYLAKAAMEARLAMEKLKSL